MCVFVMAVLSLHAGLGASKSLSMNKTMFSWIEIGQICLKMLGSRVMAVFAHLEVCYEASITLHRKLLTANMR